MIYVKEHGDFFIVRCTCAHEFEATPDTWQSVDPPVIQCPDCDSIEPLTDEVVKDSWGEDEALAGPATVCTCDGNNSCAWLLKVGAQLGGRK